MIRRSCSFIVILFASLSLLAQDSPNLQNGMPAQGSYDGGSADTVNLMNGNLTLHIPLPISTPQRGKLGIKYYLVVNAKTWKATGDPATLTGQWKPTNLCTVSTTGPCGQGPVFLSTATFGMTREWQSVFTDGVGTDYSVSTPTSIATWDGSAHGLTGSDTVLRSTDTSGYRVEISGSDGFGLPDNAVVIDRNGTRYSGTFVRGGCTKTVDGGGLPGSTTTTTCPEYFNMGQVTDANGNVLSPPVAVPELRFDWTTPAISTHAAVGTEVNGCVTSFGTPWVGYLDYPAANGQTNEIKLCFAVYPQLVTSFSPAGIQQFQAISSSYRQPIYLSNVILPDNTQWSISYDATAKSPMSPRPPAL